MKLTNEQLDDLVELWHDGAWPDCELEDVIRDRTGWNHYQYDRWVATGAQPGERLLLHAERNWCGHGETT